MEKEKKLCKMCCSEIPLAAKKCPFCQHWQSRWIQSGYHPGFIFILFLLMTLMYSFIIHDLLDKGEDFQSCAESLSVINTKIVFGRGHCEHRPPVVSVLGEITNSSDVVWDNIRLEARFFDKNDVLTDALQQRPYSQIVPSNGKAVFKLSSSKDFDDDKYDHVKIRVLSASEYNGRY